MPTRQDLQDALKQDEALNSIKVTTPAPAQDRTSTHTWGEPTWGEREEKKRQGHRYGR